MADDLPPLPPGASFMPPLPAGAEMVASATAQKPKEKPPDAPEKSFNLLTYAGHEISEPVKSAWDQLKSDFIAASPSKATADEGFWDRAEDQFKAEVAGGKLPIDAFELAVSPIAWAVHGAVIKPAAEAMTYGLDQIIPGYADEKKIEGTIGQGAQFLGPEGDTLAGATLASREGPLVTALKKSGPPPAPMTSAKAGIPPTSAMGKALDKGAARARPQPLLTPSGPYAEAVKKLQAEGIDLTLGQTHGGVVRRAEEAHKSNPLTGTAIREAENRSIQTFNRAVYNRVLAPIGEKFTGDAIGREGITQVGDKVSKAYDKIKPKLKLAPDDELLSDMVQVRTEASEMPDTQEKQFEAILNNRFLKRVGPDGTIDGETFKQIESELTHLSSVYKSSGDAAHRELGSALGDVVTALRENLERSSDPSVREELKKINTSWAMLTRLEGAAGRRAGSGGVFTTGDLLQAVKSADKSARKRTFARGDALLQDFAETAHSVLPDRLPDSGTAERQMWNNLTGVILKGAGTVTNPLYKRAAAAMTKKYAEPAP